VAGKSNELKLQTYTDICKSFHPVFRYFFLENFPTPGVWFERRLAYIHRYKELCSSVLVL